MVNEATRAAVWRLQLLTVVKRLVALALWQDLEAADQIEASIKDLDRMTIYRDHAVPTQVAATSQLTRSLRYGVGAYGSDVARLLKSQAHALTWSTQPPFMGCLPHEQVGYAPLMQTNSADSTLGLLLLPAGAHIEIAPQSAENLLFIISGHAYARPFEKAWCSSPANQFVFMRANTFYDLETRKDFALILTLTH